jgi:general secretion pathway protein K
MKPVKPSERGTALIAALLLVALMAAVSVQLVDMSRFAMFRTGHIDSRSDAYWQALGAREFTESVLQRGVDGEVMRADLTWLGEPQVFQTDSGVVSGLIEDSNNCLNVNALAFNWQEDGEAEAAGQAERAHARFDALMDRIGAPPGEARRLRVQIIDWVDADTRPEPGGAEDQTYQQFDPPYRTANRPMAELDELLALPDMTPDFFAFLEPWLCALPETTQPPLNLNTLRLDEAPLLAAAFAGRLDVAGAEAVLFRRPPQGYDALEQFFADPIIQQLELDAVDQAAVTLRSRWFAIQVDVRSGDSRYTLRQLVELDQGDRIIRHRQRFGAM